MVLRLKPRESRSLPVLLRTECCMPEFRADPAITNKALARRKTRGGFCFFISPAKLAHMQISRRTALRIGAAAIAAPALARAKTSPNLTRLTSAMAQGRFITYQPTELKVIDGKLTTASADSIRADLKVLRPNFDSLITYGAQGGAEHIPELAAEQGFRAVIMGVWDFNDKQNWRTPSPPRANGRKSWRACRWAMK